jgi:alpha-L-fucosidase
MKVNGESIYGTTYGPLQALPFGRTTAKGKTVYLHVFNWPQGKLELAGMKPKVTKAALLAGKMNLKFNQSGDKLSIDVPAQAPDPHVTVIALQTN